MPASRGLPISDEEFELLLELVRSEVPFMIVGVGAAVLQNADLVTADLDLWFRSTSDPGVAKAAEKVGGVFVWRSDPPMFSGRGLEKLDVVYKCDGLDDFDTEYARAIDVALTEELTVKVLPIERVIASKKAANRLKDRIVIPALEATVAANEEASKRGGSV